MNCLWLCAFEDRHKRVRTRKKTDLRASQPAESVTKLWQTLVSGFANCYCQSMRSHRIRQISALAAALVLAVGLVLHGFGGSDMIVKSAMTAAGDMPMSSDMPMPGKCNGCAGDEKGVAQACSAFCGAMAAPPSMAVNFSTTSIDILGPTAEPIMAGRFDPPDPYPPKLIILS